MHTVLDPADLEEMFQLPDGEYDFTDEHGHRHAAPELVDRFSLDDA